MLSGARAESEQQRKEGERRVEALVSDVETLTQQLQEASREKEAVEKELEQLSQDTGHIRAKLEVGIMSQDTGPS